MTRADDHRSITTAGLDTRIRVYSFNGTLHFLIGRRFPRRNTTTPFSGANKDSKDTRTISVRF